MSLTTAQYLSEFIGTLMLVLMGEGVSASQTLKGSLFSGANQVYTMLGWGLAVALPGLLFGAVSGASYNPALTIALACIGSYEWSIVPGFIIAEMLGGFCGACLMYLVYKDAMNEETDNNTLRGIFCTGPAIRNIPMNIFQEAMSTFMLVFYIVTMAGCSPVGADGKFLVAAIIASIGFSLGGTTGFAMNQARDTAPRLAFQVLPFKSMTGEKDADWAYGLTAPMFGPIIGGILGALLGNWVMGWLALV